jgi:hypothetical protein
MGDSLYCIFRIREVQSKCAQSSWGGIFFTQLSQQESLRFGGGSVGRVRTYDIWINSPLFYQLNYHGIMLWILIAFID